jgi:hypothetical protein
VLFRWIKKLIEVCSGRTKPNITGQKSGFKKLSSKKRYLQLQAASKDAIGVKSDPAAVNRMYEFSLTPDRC